MTGRLCIVGERRSPRAIVMGVHWHDGRLAAKPLFEALRAAGVDPHGCLFCNWFEGSGNDVVRAHRGPVVALGKKVQAVLRAEGISHIPVVHPAARGSIRLRTNYIAHVVQQLRGVSYDPC